MIEPEEEFFPSQENRGIWALHAAEPDPDAAYDAMREDAYSLRLENEPVCLECGELLSSPDAPCQHCGSQGGGTD